MLYLDYGPDKSRIMATCNGNDLYYMSHDHMGSVVTIADYRRAIVQELDYDAWGRRRDPRTMAYNVWDVKDDHGFAGHEHLDLFDMVNMDGRMYDPVAGRFLSPDPLVQAPDFTQSLNRYAYCLNNPLSLVDPTGYSWLSRSWKSIAAAVVGIAVSAVTLGSATSLGMAIAAGAAGGAASALTGSLLNGANIGQIAKATFMGGFWGAASGGLNHWCGGEDVMLSILKHAASESCLEALQGGNILHGLYMGAVAGLSNVAVGKWMENTGDACKIAASAMAGGVMEELGGGKFANGVITSAFSMMFNELMHRGPTKQQVKDIYDAYEESVEKFSGTAIFQEIGGEIAYYASSPEQSRFYQNACAARLSYAFNKAGIKIPRIKGVTQRGAGKLNYFLRAADMRKWLTRKWGTPTLIKNIKRLTTGVTSQTGFGHNISGHVGVMYKGVDPAGKILDYFDQHAPTSIWYGRKL